MKSQKTIIAIVALAIGMGAANAEMLTPQQAWNRAHATMKLKGLNSQSTFAPRLLMAEMAKDEPSLYVFEGESGKGYVVLSADDAIAPVLGYSDRVFDEANMPDGLKYWLEEYSRQIEWAREQGMAPMVQAPSRTDLAPIAPLTKTKWNQSAPFNNDCPVYQGNKCVTGCVATAMAQVMKYYNWPKKGKGSNSYKAQSINQTVSMDFSKVTFDWDNMLDIYDANASADQNAAVAELMFACGVSTNMSYTPQESGTMSGYAARALADNFSYDKSLKFLPRCIYTLKEWQDIIYAELEENGPVAYGGTSNDGGHEFVCDGYDQDGYFHFNWGWGGISDGYFTLSALDPTTQGVGGSTSGYNFDQDIIVGLKKEGQGSGAVNKLLVAVSFEFDMESNVASAGQAIPMATLVMNYSISALSGNLGLKLTSTTGKVYYAEGSSFSDFANSSEVSQWQVRIPTGLSNGTYIVTPAWRENGGEWQDMKVSYASVQSYKMNVSGSTLTFAANETQNIAFSDVAFTPVYIGSNYGLKAKISNEGDAYFHSALLPIFTSNEDIYVVGYKFDVELAPGESMLLDYVSPFQAYNNANVQPGQYEVYIIDEFGNQYENLGTVTINAAETPELTFGQLYFQNGNSASVDPNDIELCCSVGCESGFFIGQLTAVIFPYTQGEVQSVGYLMSQELTLEADQNATAVFKGAVNGLDAGGQYVAMIYYDKSPQESTAIAFTVGTSGIVDAVNDDNNAIYYDLNGIVIDKNSLAPGIYIERTSKGARLVHK